MATEQAIAQGSEMPPEVPADEGVVDEASSDVNWADMVSDQDDDAEALVEGEFEVDESGEQPASEPEALVQAEPEQVLPAQTATPAQEPAPVPTQPQTPVADTPQPPPAQAPQQALDYSSWRTQHLGSLEKHYALDADAAQALLTEPETVLPKLAAQVHMEVTENVLKAVQDMMPGMMRQVTQATEVESKAESAFFEVNPDLRGVDKAKILQIGAMFRQVNPNADSATTIQTIGSMVRTALGLPSGSVAAQGTAPAAPAAPVVQPFAPARGGGSGAAPRAPAQANPWASLIEDDD